MKSLLLSLFALLVLATSCYSQFGADYSSYGFNFVTDTHNEGLKHWTGSNTSDTSKFQLYKQDSLNNYALALKPIGETLNINYRDAGYMDLNPCSFVITLRARINAYSGSNDTLRLTLFTGSKKAQLELTSSGINYINSVNLSEQLTPVPATNQWVTYTLSLNSCSESASLVLENDRATAYTLALPDDTTPQNIDLVATSDGTAPFSAEIDHLFIHSNPIKWWLENSTTFIDDTPAGYIGTTGDRQHFLSLPNGEKIGINENAGGYITFTELTPGGPNLDPRPKFGSGGTKTLRGYFHTSNFNPVQAGVSSVSGGHLVNVITTPEKLAVESFPLHSYFQDDFTENATLVFPSGDTLKDENYPAIIDDDVYDESGLDIRHELMCELDFNTSIENVTRPNEISTVRHIAEWEYIRHPSFILQFHEVSDNQRPQFEGTPGVDNDMGKMRHKFEFRLNKDLGYEWILWRDTNQEWQAFRTDSVGDKREIEIEIDTPAENRFMVFAKTSNPDDPEAVSWFYPESEYNVNSTLQKSRTDKSIASSTDRRTSVSMIADWRKTNWCRMNLYIRNEGLMAPCNGDPNQYEAFQMEALQFFGTPNEILAEVMNYGQVSTTNQQAEDDTSPQIYPNPFSSIVTINGSNLHHEEIKIFSDAGIDYSNAIQIISQSNDKVVLKMSDLPADVYFIQIGAKTHKVYKQ
ncbi:MAG: T9SS type A sorting domain-containing protein [Saprospiraceae bacterium]